MILKIVQVGHPALRSGTTALSPAQVKSPEVKMIIEFMRATMYDAPGVGLAAPQVGISLALAVLEDRADVIATMDPEEAKARDRRPVPFTVIINPVLEVVGEGTSTFAEGCLSVSGFAARVARATKVRVHALDHKGEPQVIEAEGWHARILQHEIDHLNGGLYIDKMDTRTFLDSRANPGLLP